MLIEFSRRPIFTRPAEPPGESRPNTRRKGRKRAGTNPPVSHGIDESQPAGPLLENVVSFAFLITLRESSNSCGRCRCETWFVSSGPAQPKNPNRQLAVVVGLMRLPRKIRRCRSQLDSSATSCRFGFSSAEIGRNDFVSHTVSIINAQTALHTRRRGRRGMRLQSTSACSLMDCSRADRQQRRCRITEESKGRFS